MFSIEVKENWLGKDIGCDDFFDYSDAAQATAVNAAFIPKMYIPN